MGQRLDCGLVRDLLPNYVEHLTSQETDARIWEHLNTCEECKTIYHSMIEDIKVESAPEIKNFKKYLGWTQLNYIAWGLTILGVIGIFVSVLVDMLLNRNLTWSLIVVGGVTYGYVVLFTLFKAKKHKFLKMLLAASVFLIPLLWSIQLGMTQMDMGIIWFREYGILLSLVWLVVVWLTVLIQKAFRLNFWHTIGLLVIFAIPANVVTNLISPSVLSINNLGTMGKSLRVILAVFNGIASLIIAIILILIGNSYNRKKRKKPTGR